MKMSPKALFAVAAASVLVAGAAHAGTGGTEFQSVYDTLMEWMQGTLGKVIALAMILVGVVAGVVRQDLMAFAVGIAGGLGLYTAPTIIDTVLSATLPATTVVQNMPL